MLSSCKIYFLQNLRAAHFVTVILGDMHLLYKHKHFGAREIFCSLFYSLSLFTQSFSRVRLFETPWTVAFLAPLSMEFSRQEYWSRLPFPNPGIFLTQRSNSHPLHLLNCQVDSLPLAPPGKPVHFP